MAWQKIQLTRVSSNFETLLISCQTSFVAYISGWTATIIFCKRRNLIVCNNNEFLTTLQTWYNLTLKTFITIAKECQIKLLIDRSKFFVLVFRFTNLYHSKLNWYNEILFHMKILTEKIWVKSYDELKEECYFKFCIKCVYVLYKTGFCFHKRQIIHQ